MILTVLKNILMLYTTSIGCYERTLALLLEKYAGALPTWLAPIQVKVLPISDHYMEYANSVSEELQKVGIRVEVDTRKEKIGYKIREAQLHKIPYMLILGDKEKESNCVGVRTRKDGDIGAMEINEFIKMIKTGMGWEKSREITLETMKVLDEARRQLHIVFPADEKSQEKKKQRRCKRWEMLQKQMLP